MTFRPGRAVKAKTAPARPAETKDVRYEAIVTVTPKGILFTFQIQDLKGEKFLVDRWLPSKYLEVNEVEQVVRMPKWLYLKEWGHEYER